MAAGGWASVRGNFSWEFSFLIAFMVTYERKQRVLWCSLRSSQPLGSAYGVCSLLPDKPLCPDGRYAVQP